MTVSATDARREYNGNAVTVDFATPYFQSNSDLKVYVDDVLQTLTLDYTLSGAGNAGGGTATFGTPPPAGTLNVQIISDPPLTQAMDLIENDKNPAEIREQAFDKLTQITQRLYDKVSRTVQLSELDDAATLTLPLKADRASTLLAFDADGDPIAAAGGTSVAVSVFMATVLDDADASAALTTLGVSAFAQTLLDDADASAALTTLGVSAFAQTLLDDADASAALTTLGVSAFAQTLLDDADASAALTTLGVSAFAQTLLDDANASAARTTLGVGVSSASIVATDADLTITSEQFALYDTLNLNLSAWTVARNVIVPAVGRNFTVRHNSGTYNATVKTSAGTGIVVTTGKSRQLVCDGTNVVDPSTDGNAYLASAAEAQAGADNTKFITPLRMREGFNASGSAPVYACRAWVNFNGTGTVAIRASGNVSSITDNGTGNYTVNFTTAMPDANYGVSSGTSDGGLIAVLRSFTSSGFVIACNSTAGTGTDSAIVCASIFR